MGAGREVWVKIRASEAERAEWHAKARAVGLSLSDLVRRSVGRVRTWTVAHAELERERTRELARIGSNLNQIARWANIHRKDAEALEVVAHLVAIERALEQINGAIEPGYSACSGSCINGVGNLRFHAGFWRAGCITKGARPVRREGMRNPRWSTAARRACPTHLRVGGVPCGGRPF